MTEYTPATMTGYWTVKSYYKGNVLMTGIYSGKKANEDNKVEVVSTRTLDKRITNLIVKQKNELQEKKLKEIVETLEL